MKRLASHIAGSAALRSGCILRKLDLAHRVCLSRASAARAAIVEAVENLDLSYPTIDAAKKKELVAARAALAREK